MTKVYYIDPKYYDVAAANGISADCLRGRIYDLGWSIERAITQPPQQRYPHYTNQARANGISAKRYQERVRNGWTREEASTRPIMNEQEIVARAHAVDRLFSNEEWATARANGISRSTMYSRFHRGWSKEDAITIPPYNNTNRAKVAQQA